MELPQIFENISKNIETMRKDNFPKTGKMNILNVINKTHYENYNSDIIAYLLDPSCKHYQKDIYLKMFLDRLQLGIDINDLKNIDVSREYPTDKGRRIDIYIESDDWGLIIESKIHAKEREKQLQHYYKFVKTKRKKEPIYIFFLTLDGVDSEFSQEASQDDTVIYKNITWAGHILPWIEDILTQDSVLKDHLDLKAGLEQYKDSLDILTHKTDEDLMEQKIILESLINKDGTLQINLAQKTFSNISEVADWLSTLVPLLELQKQLRTQGYITTLVLGTTDIKKLEEFKDFTIKDYPESTLVAIKIEKNDKTIYYLYDFYYAEYYFCISDTYERLQNYEKDPDYDYHWKWSTSKGDDFDYSKTINKIQTIFNHYN